jgi:hypothetical protein
MSDKSFSQLFGSINSVPMLVVASVMVAGATAYKCGVEVPNFRNTYSHPKNGLVADVPDIKEEPIKS